MGEGEAAREHSPRIDFIDGWRTVAVGLVIFGHLSQHGWIPTTPQASGLSFVGVLIFFFISGYVVSLSCLREVASNGQFSVAGFYVRRFFRIVPPLMIYLASCVLLARAELIRFDVWNTVPAGLYFCNIEPSGCSWYVTHTWSLAFEEQFYLLFAIMFCWVELGRRPWLWILVVLIALASLPFFWPLQFVGRTGFVLIYLLFIGGYFAAKNSSAMLSQNRVLQRVAWLCATVATFSLSVFDTGAYELGKYFKFAYALSIPVMVMTSGCVAPGVFGNRPMALFGRASYSIYLWQQVVTGPPIGNAPAMVQLMIGIFALCGCLLSYHLIELRLMRWGRRIAGRMGGSSVGA